MSDLTDFLLARIADDEVAEIHDLGICSWANDTASGAACDCGIPARVLAECEAKRRIVRALVAADDRLEATPIDRIDYLGIEERRDALEFAALSLARIYADHPDCREEWKSA